MSESTNETPFQSSCFSVFLAFDEQKNAERAEQLLNRMAQALEPHEGGWLQWTKWSFSQPDFPEAYAAAEKAAMADAIFIAANETPSISLVLGCWIDRWIFHNAGRKCLVVALLEVTDNKPETGAIFDYLQTSTQGREFVFFAEVTERASNTSRLQMTGACGIAESKVDLAGVPSNARPILA